MDKALVRWREKNEALTVIDKSICAPAAQRATLRMATIIKYSPYARHLKEVISNHYSARSVFLPLFHRNKNWSSGEVRYIHKGYNKEVKEWESITGPSAASVHVDPIAPPPTKLLTNQKESQPLHMRHSHLLPASGGRNWEMRQPRSPQCWVTEQANGWPTVENQSSKMHNVKRNAESGSSGAPSWVTMALTITRILFELWR